MARRDTFRPTWNGKPVFNCGVCDRRTRETDDGCDWLCPQCYGLSGHENSVFDGCADEDTVQERDRLLKALVAKGIPADRVRSLFKTLFAFELP